MLNSYFLNGSKNEQNLIQSLVNEQLKIYGVEVYYLPRQYATEKTIIKEVIESKFQHAYPLEAYVDSYEGFGGQGTLLSKFGIQEKDDLTLVISKERYQEYISPFMKDIPGMKGVTHRPREGDLVWFPLGDKLFEIKYVEHEQPFYQLEKNYVYQLKLELFRYEDEVIDTGVEDIDDEITDINTGYTQTLTVIGVASTALATATLCSGGSVNNISIIDMGNNYSIAPVVAFSSAPFGGVTATGIATITNEFIGCNGTPVGKVSSIYITNTGCGYTVAPWITLTTPNGETGVGAAATSGISTTGSVQFVTVTLSGSGYIDLPSVGISTPKHVGAAATSILDTPSQVGAGVSVISAPISIGSSSYLFPYGTTGGVYYKTAPTVTFDPPDGTGSGALGTATIDDFGLYGGTVQSLAITTEGKFYTSPPTVTINHPGFSFVSASIGIAGSSIDPGSVAFTTTGRSYTTSPTVAITTSGYMDSPTVQAVGIATIHPITGIVTAISFNPVDPWAVGTSATVGAGYTVVPNISFSGNPSPVQATATATVSIAGTVTSLSIGNSGFGYQSTPNVSITAPTGVTTQFTATGISTIRFDSIKTTGTIGISTTTITNINTTNMVVGDRIRIGTGYSEYYNPDTQVFPDITFVTGIGVSTLTISKTTTNTGIKTAIIEVGIQNCGIVTGIDVTYGGGGYLSPPIITITNDTGEKNYIDQVLGVTTATAGSIVGASSTVESVYIINSGAQYVLTPEVVIGGIGNTNSGSGSFIFNEIVVGSQSGTQARVKNWNSTINNLEISIVTGNFVVGERIVGQDSGASYMISAVNKDDLVDTFAENDTFQSEGNKIMDFSSDNPFGMP